MKLPYALEKLKRLNLTKIEIISHIRLRRQRIRSHRNQKGDDRCWLDDFPVWALVDGLPSRPPKLSYEENMRRCHEFYQFRRAMSADTMSPDAIRDRRRWNTDLVGILKHSSQFQLIRMLYQVQCEIVEHYDIGDRPRGIDDDRRLYATLPEKVPADFRLPSYEDFLGEVLAPKAGCPSFWRSHGNCTGTCDLHKWGPCKNNPHVS